MASLSQKDRRHDILHQWMHISSMKPTQRILDFWFLVAHVSFIIKDNPCLGFSLFGGHQVVQKSDTEAAIEADEADSSFRRSFGSWAA